MRKLLIIVGATIALLVPAATASASWDSEYKAGSRTEQRVQKRYPGYTVAAYCDQQGRRFWCTLTAFRGDCYVNGHAWVSRYPWRVRLVGVTRDCF